MSHNAYLWMSRAAPDLTGSVQLRNAAMRLCGTTDVGLFVWNWCGDADQDVEPVDVSRLLSRRLRLVEEVRKAERIGIVAGTLGVSGNIAIIDRCKRVVEAAGKRWYSLVVGKPTPAKLGNFAEIDAFVLVACAQNAILESREYMRPVITPMELDLAMSGSDWFEEPYSADFADVLKNDRSSSVAAGDRLVRQDGSSDSTALTQRDRWTVTVQSAGGAAEFLKRREWSGLDPIRDHDGVTIDALPAKAAQGRSGLAGKYAGEG
jgi:diphthamide biosynthesis protein 2